MTDWTDKLSPRLSIWQVIKIWIIQKVKKRQRTKIPIMDKISTTDDKKQGGVKD
jgi:hypothetical protein